MDKNFIALNNDSIQHAILMHDALSEALSSLSNFGAEDAQTLTVIRDAQVLIDDLCMILKYYLRTQNGYQKSFDRLNELLRKIGITDCVNDLVSVNAKRHSLINEAQNNNKTFMTNKTLAACDNNPSLHQLL